VAKALGLSTEHLEPSRIVIPRKARRPLNSKLSPQKLLRAGGPPCREIEEVVRLLADGEKG
jgi:dTDP-4-dehydrorhamnose reductase